MSERGMPVTDLPEQGEEVIQISKKNLRKAAIEILQRRRNYAPIEDITSAVNEIWKQMGGTR